MTSWMSKLRKTAKTIAKEKPTLHFMGMVAHPGVPDRWDLLISSDQLEARGIDGVQYVVDLLKKHLLARERIKISLIVIMPRTKQLIDTLNAPGEFTADRLHGLYRFDEPDKVYVIWPTVKTASAPSAVYVG